MGREEVQTRKHRAIFKGHRGKQEEERDYGSIHSLNCMVHTCEHNPNMHLHACKHACTCTPKNMHVHNVHIKAYC